VTEGDTGSDLEALACCTVEVDCDMVAIRVLPSYIIYSISSSAHVLYSNEIANPRDRDC
jgi:hypothetical protein